MSDQLQSQQATLFRFIRSFFGQERILAIPTPIIELVGDLQGGLLLSQIVFWSDKGAKEEGWFWKKHEEWEREIYLSKYIVNKWVKKFEEYGWLETKLEKIKGAPTNHYRIDFDKFYEWVIERAQETVESIQRHDEEREATRQTDLEHIKEVEESAQRKSEKERGFQNAMSNFHQSIECQNFDNHIQKMTTVNDLHTESDTFSKTKDKNNNEEDRQTAFRKEQNEEWERIGRDGTEDEEESTLEQYEEVVKWARQYKMLDRVSDLVKEVSFLLHRETGIEPSYPAKGWIQGCEGLMRTAKNNQEILVRGLRLGERERKKGGLTLSHPRSYNAYVSSVVARINKPDEREAINGNESSPTSAPVGDSKVYKDSKGRTVIKL